MECPKTFDNPVMTYKNIYLHVIHDFGHNFGTPLVFKMGIYSGKSKLYIAEKYSQEIGRLWKDTV